MIRSLRANNGSFAGMGNIQIQPSPVDSVEYQVIQQTSSTQDSDSGGALPVGDVSIPVPVMLHGSGSVTHIQNTTLNDIAEMMVTDPTFLFPLESQTNQIVPTYNLTLDSGPTFQPDMDSDARGTVARLSNLELRTGVVKERPEVIMLTNFHPLFNKGSGEVHSEHSERNARSGFDRSMTAAGRYVETQFQMRSLQTDQMTRMLGVLRQRYPHLDRILDEREATFGNDVQRLREDSMFLLNAVRVIENNKKRLDLRHGAYQVKDPTIIAQFIAKNFRQHQLSTSVNPHIDLVEMLVSLGNRHAFDFSDCMKDLGYTSANVSVFCSSKIWLQTLFELRQILENHSLQLLDIAPTHQRRDNSPSNILRPQVKHFGIAAIGHELPPISELINLQVAAIPQTVNTLQSAFGSIYQNAYFKSDEARIAALAHIISREYRYSVGLSLSAVKQALQKSYGYHVADRGNSTLFESVLGSFGNSIDDLSPGNDRSMAGVAQVTPSASAGVLTFEPRPIEGGTGTLVPGGEYFFDKIMEHATPKGFDTSGCEELLKLTEEQLNQLLIVVDGLNLLMIPSRFDVRRGESTRDANASFLKHPSDTVFELASRLIDTNNGKVLNNVANDELGSVYALAKTDNKVKTILFMYTMSKISRAYGNNVQFLNSNQSQDNTPLVDNLIDRLVASLEASVPTTRSTVQLVTQPGLNRGLNTASLTPDSIKHAFKSGTVLTRLVEQFMSAVINWFKNRTTAINDSYTRYGGYLDTVIMMIAFDLAIAAVARYSGQQIVGVHRGLSGSSHGQLTFAVSRSTTNHASSFNDIIQRHNKESDLVRQLIITFTSALMATSRMASQTSNYFNSDPARSKLTELVGSLGGSTRDLRSLLTEQQIMLLSSTLLSISSAFKSRRRENNEDEPKPRTRRRGSSPTVEDDLAVFDESDVAEEMEHAILSFFSEGDYAAAQGLNKRIMTVGIPHGFTQYLKQQDEPNKKNASQQEKEGDIVQVVVYRVDMQNTDIIYKPVRFLFELSRFPIRFSTDHWLPLRDKPTVADIINAVPTQNFNFDGTQVTINVEYAASAIAGQQGAQHLRSAFNGESYSFLTPAQKTQILHNHTLSHMLEVYVRMLTGINVAEHSYYVDELPSTSDRGLVGSLATYAISNMVARSGLAVPSEDAPPTGGVLFSSTGARTANPPPKRGDRGQTRPAMSNPAGTAGDMQGEAQFGSTRQQGAPVRNRDQQSSVGSLKENLELLGPKHARAAAATLRTCSQLASSFTQFTRTEATRARVLSPRLFDRVFNIIIDANDFEIDVKKTLATPYGRQALELLIRHGEVVSVDPLTQRSKNLQALTPETVDMGRRPPRGRFFHNVNNFKLRERDQTRGDLVTDKYFITVETLEENDE